MIPWVANEIVASDIGRGVRGELPVKFRVDQPFERSSGVLSVERLELFRQPMGARLLTAPRHADCDSSSFEFTFISIS